jgi:hypothetical protein
VGADGHPFPTFILHPFQNTPPEYENFSCSSRFRFLRAPKGFIDKLNLQYVFESMIIPEITQRRKDISNAKSKTALIICDEHGSRASSKIMKLGLKNNIDIFVLPSHLSHIIQPMDCGVNKAFKLNVGTVCDFYQKSNVSECRYSFIKSVCSSADKSLVMDTILNSWKSSGLSPFNPARVLRGKRIFAPPDTKQTERGIKLVLVFVD